MSDAPTTDAPDPETLPNRSVTSVGWNAFAGAARVAVGVGRSIALARLLPVETFGAYALAGAIVGLTRSVPSFGLQSAYLNRAPETRDAARSADTYFTLSLALTTVWAIVLTVGASALLEGDALTATIALTVTTAGLHLTAPARQVLVRRVQHRRLAVLSIASDVSVTIVAIGLAVAGETLWALLATDVVTVALEFGLLYAWRPAWRPRLRARVDELAYFLRFGMRTFVVEFLENVVNRAPRLFTESLLGMSALGFLSRSWSFALMPRRLVGAPVNTVAAGAYAELKGDRRRLTQAVFGTNMFLAHVAVLVAGAAYAGSSEFVIVALGPTWVPMTGAFQFLLAFTVLDPVHRNLREFVITQGRPVDVIVVKLLQALLLVAILYPLGTSYEIAGIAAALVITLLVGVLLLARAARQFAQLSMWQVLGRPTTLAIPGLVVAWGVGTLIADVAPLWVIGVVKPLVFTGVYILSIATLERRLLIEGIARLRDTIEMPRAIDPPEPSSPDGLRIAMILLNPFTHDSRVTREARALVEAGHAVTVVALHRDGLEREEVINGVHVARVAISPWAHAGRHVGLFMKFVQFTSRATARAERVLPDVVHAHDSNTLFAAWFTARNCGARLVYDAHELERHRNIVAREMAGIYRHLTPLPEACFIRRADAVITVTDGIADELASHYGIDRPVVLRNCENWPEATGSRRLRTELGIDDDKLVVLYVGGMHTGRGVPAFARMMERLPDAVGVALGSGPMRDWLLEERDSGRVPNVRAPGLVPMEELHEYVQGGDVGVVFTEDVCLGYRLSLPNKLFQYLQAGVPVLATDLPELTRVISEHGVGETLPLDDPDALAAAAHRLGDQSEERTALLKRVRVAADATHWRVEKRKLLDVLARFEPVGRA